MDQIPIVPVLSPTAPPMPVEATEIGVPVPAIERIRLFGDREWEEFILEWVDSLRTRYVRVERCGGAGDMGRDVIAFPTDDFSTWDNYQCKHYSTSLAPAMIWSEIGKVIYYSHAGAYTLPRRYYFLAPQGAGTKLSNMLRDPVSLKTGLIDAWDSHCRATITTTTAVELDEELLAYIDTIDFSMFEAVPPLVVIDDHSKTRWHIARFGGGLPARPHHDPPPVTPTANESRFIRQVLDAYADYLRQSLSGPDDLAAHPALAKHFGFARIEFYSAEALRLFSRDTLPPGEYERLQEDFLHGISDVLTPLHPHAFARLEAALGRARILPIDHHPLRTRVGPKDRGGICHKLANDDTVSWVIRED